MEIGFCCNCQAYAPESITNGECRRRSPVLIEDTGGMSRVAWTRVFPVVDKEDWCCDFIEETCDE